MVEDVTAGEPLEGFSRENLDLDKDLEKMIEQMENISVKLTWMMYDMVVLRTSPQLQKSIKKLENQFSRCKSVIQGSED